MKSSHCLFFAAALTLAAGSVCAQTAEPAPRVKPTVRSAPVAASAASAASKEVTPEQRAEMRAKMLARTGGMITQVTSGPDILFLNQQTAVDASALDATAAGVKQFLRLGVSVQTEKAPAADGCPSKTAASKIGKEHAIVVAVVDVADCPSLLVAPEDRWALINVAHLKKGADAEALKVRTQKELWRAVSLLLGASNSSFEHCLMKPVFKVEDLDALKPTNICPEPMNKLMATAKLLGIKSERMMPYRRAVEEGWAPAPTNDVQKAVWEDVKNKKNTEAK